MSEEHEKWLEGIGVNLDRARQRAKDVAKPMPNAEKLALAEDPGNVNLAWAGELQVDPDGKAVRIGNWFQNNGATPVSAGSGQGLLSVVNSEGSQIEGKYVAPSCEALKPGGKSWTSTTVKLPAGVYNVKLALFVNDREVDRRFGALTVEITEQSYGFSFGPGKVAPTKSPVMEDPESVKLAWAGELQVDTDGNAVRIGNWFQNNGATPVSAGSGQGLLSVVNSEGSQIEGKYVAPSSKALKPGGKSWTSTTVKLPAGIYNVKLALFVNNRDVDTRFGALTVEITKQSYGCSFGPGKVAPTKSPVVEDPESVKLAWAGELQVDTEGNAVRIGNWFQNSGSAPISAGWGRGLLSVVNSEGSQIEGKYVAPSSTALKPGGKSWTSATVKLPAGIYDVKLALFVNNRAVDRRFGALTVEVTDQSYGCRFRPGK